ncbi:hypothetical protein C1646_811200 [Rhizophagus diaphanus]|nr:hypothetical protein C1646_811200 [Rhizophagus diaphanus] [Rhizophagus sp. MUCL 43196]
MSISGANPSDLEVLRQRNAELEAKNVELETRIVELEKWRQHAILNEEKIDELNAKNVVFMDEIFELKTKMRSSRTNEAKADEYEPKADDAPIKRFDYSSEDEENQNETLASSSSSDSDSDSDYDESTKRNSIGQKWREEERGLELGGNRSSDSNRKRINEATDSSSSKTYNRASPRRFQHLEKT